jgi:hypothetical protein
MYAAAAALDPAVPEDHRRYLPYMLFHGDDRLRYEVQKSRTFAKTADPDPRVRLFAAWALCEVGQVNPARKFDLLGVWRRGPDAVDDRGRGGAGVVGQHCQTTLLGGGADRRDGPAGRSATVGRVGV